MKNSILIFCILFSGFCFARAESPKEVPIYRAILIEVQNDDEIEAEGTLLLTMYKLGNSTSHPSSFTLCSVCQEQKCRVEPYCKKFFLAKQKELLRCFASRFTAVVEARPDESLIVDESMGEVACHGEDAASYPNDSRLVWNVRTYIDGNLDRSYKGYPVSVR